MKIIIICLIATIGFALLFASWKNKSLSPNKRVFANAFAWLIVVIATQFMMATYGVEYGMSYALFGLMIIPLFICLWNIDFRKKQTRPNFVSMAITLSYQKLILNVLNFLVVVPISMFFSLLLTLTISQTLPWQTINQLSLVIFVGPMVWAVAIYLYLYSENRFYIGSALTIFTVITSIYLTI